MIANTRQHHGYNALFLIIHIHRSLNKKIFIEFKKKLGKIKFSFYKTRFQPTSRYMLDKNATNLRMKFCVTSCGKLAQNRDKNVPSVLSGIPG